jgi:formate-dependent nitrite reductase membrane component NrfD
MAEQMVQVSYNAQHKIPWHWPVPAYLVTKGLAGGLFLVMAFAFLSGLVPFESKTFVAGGLLSLVMLGATGALLLYDLDRPDRFLNIMLRPQWNSWLARGAWIINAFAGVVTLWWMLETAAWLGLISPSLPTSMRTPLMVLGVPCSLGLIIYTAFLFAQAEGRDLWQSTLLPFHLLVQGLMLGGAGLGLIHLFLPLSGSFVTVGVWVMVVALLLDLFVTLFGEFGMTHASEVAARAAHDITHGRYAVHFWLGSVVLGHVVPLLLLAFSRGPLSWFAAAVCTIVGLYLFEHAYVMAPQEISNS